jgi:hypothetical protein
MKPLNLDSLRRLNQRWDSPQALIRVCPTLFALVRQCVGRRATLVATAVQVLFPLKQIVSKS